MEEKRKKRLLFIHYPLSPILYLKSGVSDGKHGNYGVLLLPSSGRA